MINGSEWKKKIDPNDLGLEIDTKRLKREREASAGLWFTLLRRGEKLIVS